MHLPFPCLSAVAVTSLKVKPNVSSVKLAVRDPLVLFAIVVDFSGV